MKIERRFTTEETGAYGALEFRTTTSEIRNPDGSVVFALDNLEVPQDWSQVASDVLAQKYFRKAGVPVALKRVREKGVPAFLWRSVADEAKLADLPEAERFTGETTARQVFDRLAGGWTYWGWKGSYFTTEADARAYYDEMRYMLATQMGAPNSPQWFNTGLHWAYGIDGPAQGHFYVDFQSGELVKSTSAYEHPQPHACFIQSVSDDLVNDGGIMDLWTREARLFKYGSGTGTNFSSLRGENEPLSGGGKSSGLMSLPQDRRPRRRRHQVGRHHAPRRQDGDLRPGSPRHRGLHQLEGDRGAEGRLARRRLQGPPRAPLGHPRRHPRLGRRRGRRLRPQGQPRPQGRHPRREEGPPARDLREARAAAGRAGRDRDRLPRPTTPTGTRTPT